MARRVCYNIPKMHFVGALCQTKDLSYKPQLDYIVVEKNKTKDLKHELEISSKCVFLKTNEKIL